MKLIQEYPTPQIAVLKLNRPDQRNALDSELLVTINTAIDEISENEQVRAVVFSTTNSKAFCSGADVAEPLTPEQGVERMQLFTDLYGRLDALAVPSIAVCVGNVVGAGAELALGADLRVLGSNLKFAMVGARFGIPVGVARLVPLVGLSAARELLFSGQPVDAQRAQAYGLSSTVVAAEDAEKQALVLAQQVCELDPDGAKQTKRMLREFEGLQQRVSRENDLLNSFQRLGSGLPQAD